MGIGGNKFNQWVQGEINSISGYRGKYFQSVGIGEIFQQLDKGKKIQIIGSGVNIFNHWMGEYIQSMDG